MKFLLIAFVLLVLISIIDGGSPGPIDENDYQIQCITHKSQGSNDKPFIATINSNKRNCYPLLWQIPKEYSSSLRTNVRSATIRDGHVGPALLVSKVPNEVIPIWKKSELINEEIFIKTDTPNHRSEPRIKQLQKIAVITYKLKEVDSNFNGFRVYFNQKVASLGKKPAKILFTKSYPTEYYIRCNAFGLSSYKQVAEDEYCNVVTEVDGRVLANYRMHYGQIAEIDSINQSVIEFLKKFMLN